MSPCDGCSKYCCTSKKVNPGVSLQTVDCIKFIIEFSNDDDYSLSKGLFSRGILRRSKLVAKINYFIGLNGNLVHPCPYLDSDLLCDLHNRKVRNPLLNSWLESNHLSNIMEPLVCRAYPFITYPNNYCEVITGLTKTSKQDLIKEYNNGCLIALNKLSAYETTLLNNEIKFNIDATWGFVKKLLAGDLHSILK